MCNLNIFLDDGLKENILYVSAGPRNNNESERAVYASVTKNTLEDNANVYADVKKDGKKAKTEAAIYSDVKPKKGTSIRLFISFDTLKQLILYFMCMMVNVHVIVGFLI